MNHSRVISTILTLYLLLMASALTAFAQSPVQAKSSGELPVLQLDTPARFLNSDSLPLHIPSGAYLVTASPPDKLQLTSTSTGEMQNVHATTMTHTESLKMAFPFLIEEADEQRHLHLILLLPDGRGLDAEGRWEEIKTRGIGDLNSSTFTPTRRYTGVIMQQGRVTLDDDFNEQEAVSTSPMSRLHSKVAPFYGRVTLEQGRLQLDAKARQSLLRRCRFCVKKP